jgi:hypothetical protein
MYFIAEEIPSKIVPEGYSLCFVPKIDLHDGNIDSHHCDNDEKAAKICGDILKDRTKYVLWFRSI